MAEESGRTIGPVDVARVLDRAKVPYVLVGAHAANGYTGRPRNTVDVDVVVRSPKKATEAVAKAFPELTANDHAVVVRFKRADGEEAIDLMKPLGSKLWPELIKIARSIKINGYSVRVPPLEGVLAAKLAAMVSLSRRLEDKYIDVGDFIRIVNSNTEIDETLLARLGDLVFPEGGKEILRHLKQARAGKPLSI